MFALVKDGQVIKTTSQETLEWGGFTYSNIYLLDESVRKDAGIYMVVQEPQPIVEGKRLLNTRFIVDDILGVVTEIPVYFDKSESEIRQEKMSDLKNQITQLESTIDNRRLREAVLSDSGKEWLTNIEVQIKSLRDMIRYYA